MTIFFTVKTDVASSKEYKSRSAVRPKVNVNSAVLVWSNAPVPVPTCIALKW